MAKAPAFQFYVENFLVGTAAFTAQEVGAYFLLLCHQWDKGFITDDEEFLKETARVPKAKLKKVLKKFEAVEENIYKNTRLEEERLKTIKYRETQSSNGSKGGRPSRTEKPTANPRVSQNNPSQSSSSSTSSSTSSADVIAPPTVATETPIRPFLPLEELAKRALADRAFMEAFWHKGLEGEKLRKWVMAFNRWLEFSNDKLKQEKDYRHHFSNWITRQNPLADGDAYQPTKEAPSTTPPTKTAQQILAERTNRHV